MTDDSPLCDGDPLARQLAALAPAPPALTRDQLMFAAGQASRDGDVRFWKRLTAAQPAALAVFVGVGLAMMSDHPTRGMPDRAEGRPTQPEPPKSDAAPRPQAYPPVLADSGDPAARARLIQLRADVFAVGLNVLPSPVTPPPAADPDKLEKDLHLPRGLFAVPGRPMPLPDPESPE